jgi:RNA polymerase-binding transcription factor DksA
MTTLTSSELEQIRCELTCARADLLRQAGVLADSDQVLAAARNTAEERAKSTGDADLISVERVTIAGQSKAVTDGLAEIDAALARLDAGTYGTCARCRRPIPAGRLLARPRSTTCVTCASRR